MRLPALLLLAATLPAAHAADGAGLRFTDATRDSGIEFRMTSGKTPSREILEVNGGGLALFDYDADGDLDLFVANGATMDDPEHGPGSRLFANDGTGKFTDVTGGVGIDLVRRRQSAQRAVEQPRRVLQESGPVCAAGQSPPAGDDHCRGHPLVGP